MAFPEGSARTRHGPGREDSWTGSSARPTSAAPAVGPARIGTLGRVCRLPGNPEGNGLEAAGHCLPRGISLRRTRCVVSCAAWPRPPLPNGSRPTAWTNSTPRHKREPSNGSPARPGPCAGTWQIAARTHHPAAGSEAEASEKRMGELARQLERRRGGLSVRKLMDTYGDLITQIMPCMLVSPDSVARFFPAASRPFDIVVFDEARRSGWPTPSAPWAAPIGGGGGRQQADAARRRSRKSSQRSRDDAENGVTAVEDEESILTECVRRGCRASWLSWHYRSQDESLIAFSNRHYYEGKLSSFPSPRHGAAHAGPRRPRRFPWCGSMAPSTGPGPRRLLRTNPVEAQRIVARSRRRFDASPSAIRRRSALSPSTPQQRDLDREPAARPRDERLGSPRRSRRRPRGAVREEPRKRPGRRARRHPVLHSLQRQRQGQLPLNFGPLNRAGGERRLNVAITRARRQVIVFSSFDPGRAAGRRLLGPGHQAPARLSGPGRRGNPRAGQRIPLAIARDRHREQVAAALA